MNVIPGFNTKFIDEKTGLNSREWYRFFNNLQAAAVIVAFGNVDLVAGTATVNTAAANDANEFQLTAKAVSGSQGMLSVGTVIANTSFVINSSNAGDTSTVSWAILKPTG